MLFEQETYFNALSLRPILSQLRPKHNQSNPSHLPLRTRKQGCYGGKRFALRTA